MTYPHHNSMTDFRPVFNELRKQIKQHARFMKAWKQVRKLKPGVDMETRVAARTAERNAVRALHTPLPCSTIQQLLTTHCWLRGKPANHGITGDLVPWYCERVVAQIRKELGLPVPEATPA